MKLRWGTPDNNQDSFKVQELIGGTWTTLSTLAANATSYSVTGLTASTAYSFRVIATNSLGDSSAASASADTFDASLPTGWSDGDIGSPGVAGFAGYDSLQQSFTVNGAGSDIWSSSDQFHFLYQSFSGDGSIVARINSQDNTNAWAKSGLMIRQSLDANAAYAGLFLTPSNGFAFESRTAAAGTTSMTSTAGTSPKWLKLSRSGNRLAGYVSSDGQTWSFAGAATISLSDPLYIGMATTSHNTSAGGSANFDHVSIGAPAALPSSWQNSDVGSPAVIGSSTYDSGSSTFTLSGGGSDIYGTSDQLSYDYQTLSGDGQVTARVVSQGNTNAWAKAGVMIRQSLDTNAVSAEVLVTPSNGIQFQTRGTTGGTITAAAGPSVTAPYCVRLVRSGSTLTGYVSSDGQSWRSVGTATISMSDPVFIGMAVSSHNTAAISNATFDNVAIGAATFVPSAPTRVTVEDLSGTDATIRWLGQSTNETGFKVEASSDSGSTWQMLGTAGAGSSAFNASGLLTSTTYQVRVSSIGTGGTSLSAAAGSALVTPATDATQSYVVKLPDGGAVHHGSAGYTTTGSLQLLNADPNHPDQSMPITAGSWQEAVRLALGGTFHVSNTDTHTTIDYDFATSGAFDEAESANVSGLPATAGKVVTFEDQYSQANSDLDYNDDYVKVEIV